MIHTNAENRFDKVEFLLGSPAVLNRTRPLAPFAEETTNFLDALSKSLRTDPESASYPDMATLAFWCRKGNISKLKADFCDQRLRLGRGLLFHIAPSNVPINFAFSFLFGLLAGCGNIVRVPSKDFPQSRIFSRIASTLLQTGKYPNLAPQNALIRYERSDELTRLFSAVSDGRIIWGGDAAIESIRQFPIKPRGVEVAFADRTSFAVFSEKAAASLTDSELLKLAKQFYNDTYLMDQNACSSPHLIVWLTDGEPDESIHTRFWRSLAAAAKDYDLPPIKSVDKYTLFCENAVTFGSETIFEPVIRYGNLLYTVKLKSLPENPANLRGTCGLFYELSSSDLSVLSEKISSKFQTVVTFGISAKEIAEWVVSERLTGIDRVVPVGSALDIGTIWDGFDLINTLSRIIDF